MPAWSRPNLFAAMLRFVLAFALALALGSAQAEGIRAKTFELLAQEEHFVLNGSFEVQLNDRLEEALKRGVTITFIQEFELSRSRDYWMDEGLAETSRTVKLSHNALLRSFTVNTAGRLASYDTLADALNAVGNLSNWAVSERAAAKKKTGLLAAVRMYVDLSQLPKPLQVNAFASDRWQMDSNWVRWQIKN